MRDKESETQVFSNMIRKVKKMQVLVERVKHSKLWQRRSFEWILLALLLLLLLSQLSFVSASSNLQRATSANVRLSQLEQSRGAHQISKGRERRSSKEKEFAPKFSHEPQNALVQPNKPHTIECPVESNPEAEVRWFKDRRVLASEPSHLEITGNELMFFQINQRDSGQYHCEASNYLGSIRSQPFRLSVETTTSASQANAPDNGEEAAKIRVEPAVAEVSADQQVEFTCSLVLASQASSQSAPPEVGWRQNGRNLEVKWLEADSQDLTARSRARSARFVARRIKGTAGAHLFVLTITEAQLKDDNTTFTCLYKQMEPAREEEDADSTTTSADNLEMVESAPATLRVYEQVKLNSNQVPDDLIGVAKERQPLSNNQSNITSQLNGRKVNSLKETLADLYELAKPTLIIFGFMLLASAIVVLQLVYIRRRNRQNRYMKHQYSGSGSSNASSALGCSGSSASSNTATTADPVLDSLMSRTLSAPSTVTLSGASKKYKSYRDHLRKVAATSDLVANDLVDEYFAVAAAAAAAHQQQQQQANNSNELPCEPFFAPNLPLTNLYSQSVAAREQAKSLLQASEHMRSLSNLNQAAPKHAAKAKINRLSRNGSHLNLPFSFAFEANQHQQHLMASLWMQQASKQQQLDAKANGSQKQQQLANQQLRPLADEHYQLVNCAQSISPASSSSNLASNSSTNQDSNRQRDSNSSSNNHYSTIDANEDENGYEELGLAAKRSGSQMRPATNQRDSFRDSRTSTFVTRSNSPASALKQPQTHSQNHRSSIRSDNSESNSQTADPSFTGFWSKRSNETQKTRPNFQDQLSPYAVSSICGSFAQPPPPPPPPLSSEAMRALNEQFDINQLMILEDSTLFKQSNIPFDAPPPPPTDCLTVASELDERSQRKLNKQRD